MPSDTKARREARTSVPAAVRILWQDAHGEDRFATVRSYDISESGMRLELPERVEPRSYVTLMCPELGVHGAASVRYCTRQGMRYMVGLEFVGGMKWHRPEKAEGPAA